MTRFDLEGMEDRSLPSAVGVMQNLAVGLCISNNGGSTVSSQGGGTASLGDSGGGGSTNGGGTTNNGGGTTTTTTTGSTTGLTATPQQLRTDLGGPSQTILTTQTAVSNQLQTDITNLQTVQNNPNATPAQLQGALVAVVSDIATEKGLNLAEQGVVNSTFVIAQDIDPAATQAQLAGIQQGESDAVLNLEASYNTLETDLAAANAALAGGGTTGGTTTTGGGGTTTGS